MTIEEFLAPEHVAVGVRASSKPVLMADLARRAAQALAGDATLIRTALDKREILGSTGVGDGIALPHARIDGVVRPFGLLMRLREAVAFDAIDERPVDLVFLLLLPSDPQAVQRMTLACVARRLRAPDVAAAMRGARDAAALYAIMLGAEPIR
ncbi:PTS transporter subunit EIIA [Methylobacterium sp. BTF04]|uniref:PTS sugar transporter subunit IIA n=1 Tax=Methylobacterium sp. BTF04 TaxID=2708300 RepID=UPI0013D690E1|nr:PTS sugar transporter subunit IIA [Methylobacterium sp. BTF04]NEU12644.1 PTS transporter subunit EIIA [Methylobacterium sp. BTF04]